MFVPILEAAMDQELLQTLSLRFADSIRSSFRDMLGLEISPETSVPMVGRFAPNHRLVVMIHFTGPVQGDFVVNLEEDTAARLIGAWSDGMGSDDLRGMRSDFGGFLKEALNTAVGIAIPSLEEHFGRLTYYPPMVVYGELDAPDIPGCTIELRSGAGVIDCCLVIDLSGGDAERMLVRAIADLETAKNEVTACCKVLADLVEHSRHSAQHAELVAAAERVLAEVRNLLPLGAG